MEQPHRCYFFICYLLYSIRISHQYRICFLWQHDYACQVEIVDYHQVRQMAKLENIHPGDILLHEFLEPMGTTSILIAKRGF